MADVVSVRIRPRPQVTAVSRPVLLLQFVEPRVEWSLMRPSTSASQALGSISTALASRPMLDEDERGSRHL